MLSKQQSLNNNNYYNNLIMILEGERERESKFLTLKFLEGLLKTRARLERPTSCTKGFRFRCSASMLSFCRTVCRLHRLMIVSNYVFTFQIFLISLRIICTEGSKKTIIIRLAINSCRFKALSNHYCQST